jgi:hypothetical protein
VIPLIRVSGSHTDAGATIGAATADAIRRRAEDFAFDHELVLRYRAASVKYLPWVVDELDSAAEAAEVDQLTLFAMSVEELEKALAPAHCTDVAASASLTADGHLLVAHNNDLDFSDLDDIVAIEWRVEDEPKIFTLGIGPWISVGWNEAGLSVTGNEVSPKDEASGSRVSSRCATS